MTLFNELDDKQKEVFMDLALVAIKRKIDDDTKYTDRVFRLLLLGNAFAIFLIVAYATKAYSFSELTPPLWKYIVGVVFAGFMNIPLWLVSLDATTIVSDQWKQFFLNKADLDTVAGWSLNKTGARIFYFLLFTSLFFFCLGSYQVIRILL